MPDRVMSPAELDLAEAEASVRAMAAVNAYLCFPTARNFDLSVDALRLFQATWMNGRKRAVF